MRLADKVAIVTGAASGFGRTTAVRFAEEGARVVVADLDESGGAETVQLVAAAGAGGRARGRRRVHRAGGEPRRRRPSSASAPSTSW